MKSRIIAINNLGIKVIESLPLDVLHNLDIYHIHDQKNHSSLPMDKNLPKVTKIITNTKDLNQINYIFDCLDLYIVICDIQSEDDYNFVIKILNTINNKSEVILLFTKSNFLSYDFIKKINLKATTTMLVSDISHSTHEFGALRLSENRDLLINNFVNSIVSINRIIYETGDINIDFADLMSVIKDSNTSWFGHSRSSGKNKSTEVINKLLDLQFYQEGFYNATSMIVQIVSGEEIKMSEVKELTDKIKSFANNECNIFFGIKRKKLLHNEIELIVLASTKKDYIENNSFYNIDYQKKYEKRTLSLSEIELPPFMRKQEKIAETY
ncbi:MAG: hypothetical protein CL714_00850 [Chloroflexi bacterium]|nr:hypothetical protein [Chloroflexota bacterium]|tara:strand:- start:26683 stop:27657 length:975 start_codon:yes stop_codon:yes gene_type:complete